MAQLKSNLRKIIDSAPGDSKKALTATGLQMTAMIKPLVPVDTGDLQRSYMSEMLTENTMIFGSNQYRGVYARPYTTYYAPHVEFGWGKGNRTPKPHFLPVWSRAEAIYLANFKAIFGKG